MAKDGNRPQRQNLFLNRTGTVHVSPTGDTGSVDAMPLSLNKPRGNPSPAPTMTGGAGSGHDHHFYQKMMVRMCWCAALLCGQEDDAKDLV